MAAMTMERGIEKELKAAQTLAEFANLEPKDAEYFRQKKFVPDVWWVVGIIPDRDERPDSEGFKAGSYLWQDAQRAIREAWKTGFPLDICISLIQFGVETTLQTGQAVGRPFHFDPDHFGSLRFGSVQFIPSPEIMRQVWDYQRAVIFLHTRRWRVAHCMNCGKPFVKEAKGRKYCSDICYAPHRRVDKAAAERRRRSRAKGKQTRNS
jgi:hypothetical protein